MLWKRHFRIEAARLCKRDPVRVREAGGDDGFKPRIEATDERRQRSSTRASGGAQTLRVHIGPAGKIVERSLRVPDKVTRDAFPDEAALSRFMQVLINRPSGCGSLEL